MNRSQLSAKVAYIAPSEEEFVQRARDLVPMLREKSAQTNLNRMVSKETVAAFREAGFLRLLQPKRFGGYEADFTVFSRVLEELAQGCGSSAWVCSVLGEHAWFISCFSEQAQEEVWGDDPDACASASYSPKPMRPVDGGYMVSGSWSFSSGCDHAKWVYLGGISPNGMMFMLVPVTDLEIVDDWYAMGLRGTGSKTLKLKDVFVPSHRTISAADFMAGMTPGAKVHPNNYLPHTPVMTLSPYSLQSVILGLGRRALEHFKEGLTGKVGPGGVPAADHQMLQYIASESASEIEQLTLWLRDRCRKAVENARMGRTTAPIESFDGQRDFHVLAHRIVQVVLRIGVGSGSRWVYDNDPLQMMLRDVITASAHRGASWESMIPAGREALGLPQLH